MFYDLFCELCKQKNVAPTRAALDMGISKATPTTWKNKGITPQAAQLQKIADYFGVSVDYLLGNEQKEKPHTDESGMRPNEKLLLENFRELSPEMQEFVLSSVFAQSEKLKKEQNQ